MKRMIIDTNAYTAFKKNDESAIAIFQSVEYIGINIVVLGELLSGFTGGNKELQNKKELEQLLDSSRVEVIVLDEETSEFYAKIFTNLKKKGRPVPTNDIWIAASAMQHGLSLFTYDDHFKNIDGLILHN